MPEKNLHKNHRQRLRDRFKREGLDHFEPHQILELLLFYTRRQGDTNPTGHLLIDTFGSIDGVFDAEYDDLIKVNGIGEESAVLLKLIPQVCRRYMSARYEEGYRFTSPDDIGKMFQSLYIGADCEILYALFMDNSGKMLKLSEIARGTYNEVHMDARMIAEHAMRVKSTTVVVAHNHSKGIALPSSNDITATQELVHTLRNLDIRLEDHIICAIDDFVSMRLSQKYKYIFD